MKIKKFAAVVAAAAVLAVAAPITGVLPDTLSVVASAASPDPEPKPVKYKVGDVFAFAMNPNG